MIFSFLFPNLPRFSSRKKGRRFRADNLHERVAGFDVEQFVGVQGDATLNVEDHGRLRGAHVGR